MKITKSTRNHPKTWATISNGVLIIEDNKNKYEIKNKKDFNKFVDYLKENNVTFEEGFICSSSIDFPEDNGASEELIEIVRHIFYN